MFCIVQCILEFFLGNWLCLRVVCTAGIRKDMAGANSHKYARLYRNIQPFDKNHFVATASLDNFEEGSLTF